MGRPTFRHRHGFQLPLTFLLALGAATLTSACGAEAAPQMVSITGVDYAFAVPDSIMAGPTVLRLENAGAVDHELAIARLREGVTLAQVLEAMEAGRDPEDLMEEGVGVLFASPGEASVGQLLVDLVSGSTYAFLCFLQDDPDAPPHNALGMVASVEVK